MVIFSSSLIKCHLLSVHREHYLRVNNHVISQMLTRHLRLRDYKFTLHQRICWPKRYPFAHQPRSFVENILGYASARGSDSLAHIELFACTYRGFLEESTARRTQAEAAHPTTWPASWNTNLFWIRGQHNLISCNTCAHRISSLFENSINTGKQ